MRSGVIYDMPFAEYIAGDEISNSGLREVNISPGHYRWRKDHPRPSSPAMDIGSAVDDLLSGAEWKFVTSPAGPDDLPEWCELAPSSMRKADKERRAEIESSGKVPIKESSFDLDGLKMATNCGKAWRERIESEDFRVISRTDQNNVQNTVDAIKAHPLAAEILAASEAQVSMFAEVEGVPVRTRPDFGAHGFGLTDLKCTHDVRPSVFNGVLTSFGYHWQAALYRDVAELCGWDVPAWRWIVAVAEPPYPVAVSEPATESLLEVGRSEYLRALETYKACRDADVWPASEYAPVAYDLRAWKYHTDV